MPGGEYIARCRDVFERPLAHRLHVEQVRRGEEQIDGLALEYAFANLARATGARRRQVFHGWATTLSHTFTKDQRRLLYCMIDKIILDRPPKTMWLQPPTTVWEGTHGYERVRP